MWWGGLTVPLGSGVCHEGYHTMICARNRHDDRVAARPEARSPAGGTPAKDMCRTMSGGASPAAKSELCK
jgi:hypothetical protein